LVIKELMAGAERRKGNLLHLFQKNVFSIKRDPLGTKGKGKKYSGRHTHYATNSEGASLPRKTCLEGSWNALENFNIPPRNEDTKNIKERAEREWRR